MIVSTSGSSSKSEALDPSELESDDDSFDSKSSSVRRRFDRFDFFDFVCLRLLLRVLGAEELAMWSSSREDITSPELDSWRDLPGSGRDSSGFSPKDNARASRSSLAKERVQKDAR
jgi:hypothetical protein